MYNLVDLARDLNTGEFGKDFCDYSDGYICDIIAEMADSNVDIYNSDLWNWAKENEEWIGEAISNGLYSFESSRDFDLMRLFQAGQYEYNTHDLYKNLDDNIKNFIYNYLMNDKKLDEISEELDEFIDELCDNVDNNERLESFIEKIDEFMDESENENEEEEEND